MVEEFVQDTMTVRRKRGAMMMKILGKKDTGVNSFTTLEDTEDDTSQENMKSIKHPGTDLLTPGMTPSLLLSSCALSLFCFLSLFYLLYLNQNHSSC